MYNLLFLIASKNQAIDMPMSGDLLQECGVQSWQETSHLSQISSILMGHMVIDNPNDKGHLGFQKAFEKVTHLRFLKSQTAME